MATVGILGLGLIGGSLGLDLTRLGHRVLGVSQRGSTCALACERGAVSIASTNWQLLKQAEVVFSCVPLDRVLASVVRLGTILTPGTVITDVASVKDPIVAQATQQWPWFVGGHPMAGTAEQGMGAALHHLFRQRPYVLTPLANTNRQALSQVETLIRPLEARVLYCDPVAHDQAVALISHGPVFISAALLQTVTQVPLELKKLTQQLASSGFRDTSRVGGGNPELGLLMAQHNQKAVLAVLAQYQQQLTQLQQAIEQSDWTWVEHYLKTSQGARPDFVRELE